MKIAYLIQGTYNSGGMERVLCNKSNWLALNGFEVSIITTDQRDREQFFTFMPEIKHYDLGINYSDNIGVNFVSKTLSYIKKQKQYKMRLLALLMELKVDIVVSMFGNEIGFLYSINDGSKKIIEIHFSKYFRMQLSRRGLWRLADKYRSFRDESLVKKYEKFVVLTNEDKGYWGNYPNIEVIHNAATFQPMQVARLENKRVISVGRLTFQKGYDMLIDTWAMVAKRHPDWRLTIVGSGEELLIRQKQIDKLALGGKIDLMPPTPNIEREYLDSSIFVMSSRYEGMPMVLVEAMACGLPVVSFSCKCGPRDVITDGQNGVLVKECDIYELADAICKLIENSELRLTLGSNAIESVCHEFNQGKIMKQWVKLFNSVSNS